MLSPAAGSPGRARSARWCAGPRVHGGLSMPMGSTGCMRILHMQGDVIDVVMGTQPAAPAARPATGTRAGDAREKRGVSVAHATSVVRSEGFGRRFYLLVYLAAF